jgi:hypothetical protein
MGRKDETHSKGVDKFLKSFIYNYRMYKVTANISCHFKKITEHTLKYFKISLLVLCYNI